MNPIITYALYILAALAVWWQISIILKKTSKNLNTIGKNPVIRGEKGKKQQVVLILLLVIMLVWFQWAGWLF